MWSESDGQEHLREGDQRLFRLRQTPHWFHLNTSVSTSPTDSLARNSTGLFLSKTAYHSSSDESASNQDSQTSSSPSEPSKRTQICCPTEGDIPITQPMESPIEIIVPARRHSGLGACLWLSETFTRSPAEKLANLSLPSPNLPNDTCSYLPCALHEEAAIREFVLMRSRGGVGKEPWKVPSSIVVQEIR